ncbi:hypothetical protein HG536_0G04060 [Torulaspora globosa]|uniref:Uncharacterized protein n=1 Tax=Torulaspora globosa TaxID=48254 RepID=A0A7G3ZM08_9SACH|nr:uncharacterized protein HG536_0G04060 [Torulaspora globosa]QLL34544.1 hypothetical protein HG536_0G04060 [Torulaspora globosa]
MPPKLPGLYFDEVKGRYFPLKASVGSEYGEREQKKRKIRLQREEHARQLKDQRCRNYEKYASRLVGSVDKLFGGSDGFRFANALEIEATSVDSCVKSNLEREIYDLGIRLHNMNGPVVCEQVRPDRLLLATSTTEGAIIGVEQLFNGNGVVISNYLSGNSEISCYASNNIIRFTGNSFGELGLYCHMAQAVTTLHTFTRVRRRGEIIVDTLHRELGSYGNVYDSVNLGRTFIVAAGSSLQVCSWNDKSNDGCRKFRSFPNKSDILCLAVKSGDPGVLYAGTRNGWIYVVPVERNGTLSQTAIKRFKVQGARSIISIKTTDTQGLIFVSAISNDTHQALLLLDTMLEPEECTLATFRTSFSNVTRDQEFFEVTHDGRFLLYGSATGGNGSGDFEVFSSHLGDNLAHERNGRAFTFFPLNSLRDGYLKYPEFCALRDLQLRSAIFINCKRNPGALKYESEMDETYSITCPEDWRVSAFLRSESNGEYYARVTMLLKRIV